MRIAVKVKDRLNKSIEGIIFCSFLGAMSGFIASISFALQISDSDHLLERLIGGGLFGIIGGLLGGAAGGISLEGVFGKTQGTIWGILAGGFIGTILGGGLGVIIGTFIGILLSYFPEPHQMFEGAAIGAMKGLFQGGTLGLIGGIMGGGVSGTASRPTDWIFIKGVLQSTGGAFLGCILAIIGILWLLAPLFSTLNLPFFFISFGLVMSIAIGMATFGVSRWGGLVIGLIGLGLISLMSPLLFLFMLLIGLPLIVQLFLWLIDLIT